MSGQSKMINFGPGPAKLPVPVMDKIHKEMFNYDNLGISILELSHRSADFANLLSSTEKLIRDLMKVPDDYVVMFTHGGGTGQFAAIPLNLHFLCKDASHPSADYCVTGAWSEKAAKEAKKFLHVNPVLESTQNYTTIPPTDAWKMTPDSAGYLYYCANETIHGIEFHGTPDVDFENVNLVADISSNILSRPFDVSKHALVYAGTQKNLGIAGLTIVMVRKNLLGHAKPHTPAILSYADVHKNNSLVNTPPCFPIYVTKLILEWIRDSGGPEAIFELNRQKSSRIYDIIDSSNGFYKSDVEKQCRSQMNIPFRICGPDSKPSEALEAEFLKMAKERNMISLKGHRSVGGIRASLYNAITLEETEQLAQLMIEFKELKRQ